MKSEILLQQQTRENGRENCQGKDNEREKKTREEKIAYNDYQLKMMKDCIYTCTAGAIDR